MSRIHEALRKAAEERSTEVATALKQSSAEEAGRIRLPDTIEASLIKASTQGRTVGGSGKEPSQYEELVKRCAHPSWRPDRFTSVFQGATARNEASEKFRTLRSRLYQAATTRTLRRLLITSSVTSEGKTFVASNLAQTIVQQPDRRVLLIDADLREPKLHLSLGAPRSPGLSDFLEGEADEYGIVQKGLEENLCLVSAGRSVSKPSELLLGEKLRNLLDCLTPMFDFVIIDSPPVLPVHDASILAGLSDGVLFIIRAGTTPLAAAEKAAAEFRNKNLLGVVFNQVRNGDKYGEYYHERTESFT